MMGCLGHLELVREPTKRFAGDLVFSRLPVGQVGQVGPDELYQRDGGKVESFEE